MNDTLVEVRSQEFAKIIAQKKVELIERVNAFSPEMKFSSVEDFFLLMLINYSQFMKVFAAVPVASAKTDTRIQIQRRFGFPIPSMSQAESTTNDTTVTPWETMLVVAVLTKLVNQIQGPLLPPPSIPPRTKVEKRAAIYAKHELLVQQKASLAMQLLVFWTHDRVIGSEFEKDGEGTAALLAGNLHTLLTSTPRE